MDKQMIVTISREYGTGGHEIGRHIAERYNIPFYDRNLLDKMFADKNVDKSKLYQYDETPKKGLTRSVRGFTTDNAVTIAEMQFEYLREKAESGESFVIVGRCAETVLSDYRCRTSIFISGDYETKLERVMEKRNFDAKEAAMAITRHDKSRKAYHNHFCDTKWGDSRAYEICINSSKLGIMGTVDLICEYLDRYHEKY